MDDILVKLQNYQNNPNSAEHLINLTGQPGFQRILAEIEGLILKSQINLLQATSSEEIVTKFSEWKAYTLVFNHIQTLLAEAHAEVNKNYN